MKREDDEQLWDLLGHAAERKLSLFFARNVLRQVRREPHSFQIARAWLSWRGLLPASGLAIAMLAAIMVMHHPSGPQKQSQLEPDVVAKIDPQDYEVVADLDDLLASEENSLWDENSTL